MNARLLERQLIEARIHADTLSRTIQQLEALKTSFLEATDDIIIEMGRIPQILEEECCDTEIRPLCTSLEKSAMQLQEIADSIGYSIIVPLVEEGLGTE